MSVAAIIFSKDRPCQLDLLLRSLDQYAPSVFGPILVLTLATTADFAAGYRACEEERAATFVREADFRSDVAGLVDAVQSDHLTFFTDDDVLYRPLGTNSLGRYLEEDVLCLSLRLGRNTTRCYPYDREQAVPHFETRGRVFVWDWRRGDGDFGYPMSLDGHVFRTETIRDCLDGAEFANPNELEDALVRVRPIRRPLMAAFPESRLVSIPANRVGAYANRHGSLWTTEDLNQLYLAGLRIDLDALERARPVGAHHEILYELQ